MSQRTLSIRPTFSFTHCVRKSIIHISLPLKERKKVKSLSRVPFFVTPWTVAQQAPPSVEFSRQEYCSGLLFPSPGGPPDPGIELRSPALQADALLSELPGKPVPAQYQFSRFHIYAGNRCSFLKIFSQAPEKWLMRQSALRDETLPSEIISEEHH